MILGRYIGVMSGTSLDGIDVVLAEINATEVVLQASYCHPIPAVLRQMILAICQGQSLTLSQLGQLDVRLGKLFAEAVLVLMRQQGLKANDIRAIGCHGQTLWHEPGGDAPNTLQAGDNNCIAAMTGVTVVGDFRRRDMALGGQGAPLVPAFHQALLMHKTERRIVLNIGGIANISLLFPGEPVRGYDTGPGNMLMDAWISHYCQRPYDKDARWAASGTVNRPLLQMMRADPWFTLPAPRSTGREYFNLQWIAHKLQSCPDIAPNNVQATLLALTASTIVDQVRLNGRCDRLLVCGGGARNPLLMQQLSTLLPDSIVTTTDLMGIPGDDMEGLAFAWLAYRTLSGLPGNLPVVTGAAHETILGAIFPAYPAVAGKIRDKNG